MSTTYGKDLEVEDKYIIFEGADGIGKTVLAKNFAKDIGAEFTFEPFGFDQTTMMLRRLALTKDVPKLAREYLLLTNRAFGYQMVESLLDEGKTVVTDRSFISGAVYACMEGFSFTSWSSMALPIIQNQKILRSPLVIFCTNTQHKNKVDPEDRYDSKPENFHRRVQSVFRLAFAYFGLSIVEFNIDFELSPEENLIRLKSILNLV